MKQKAKEKKSFSVNTFHELKKLAYKAAVNGLPLGFNDVWKNNYLGCYSEDSFFWLYEDTVNIYKGYLEKTLTEDTAKKSLQEIEEKFKRMMYVFGNGHDFIGAAIQKFKAEGIEFGEMDFTCPICFKTAQAVRVTMPEGFDYKVTIRAACSGCGTKMLT